MRTSIMMATYNRLELTKRTLDSLINNTNKIDYRLIIIDNGSTDGTVDWLRGNKEENFEYEFNLENKGIAVARNQALLIANKYNDPFLSTIDNDIQFPKNWLFNCLSALLVNDKLAIGINFEGVNYPIHNLNGVDVQLKPAGNLGTACTVFNRDLHKIIGYFTTEFGLYGEEDADFFFRARLAGYKMAYLLENGIHLGEGEMDVGEYREFKTKCHKDNLDKFIQTCNAYSSKKLDIYVPYKDIATNTTY